MTDDELIKQLLCPMGSMQIADNGFSDRVMRQLPRRNVSKLSHLWTAICCTAAITLFILTRGWELIGYTLLMLINHLPTQQQLWLTALSAAVAGIVLLGEHIAVSRSELKWYSH